MPFGAEVLKQGGVRFRLFAPAAESIHLKLNEDAHRPMQPLRDEAGWFSLDVAEAGVGSLYQYVLPDGTEVPDPASRYQPRDVHGPSEVIDPAAYNWNDADWKGRPWEEAVLYELHVGTFTPEGTFRSATAKLDHLAELGVTAIELMCLADFAGNRNWGYDGALLYAPDSAYGPPADVKTFIDAAHARGIMVILDVVYNHFGPEGNYLHLYFPQICCRDHEETPWGQALNFDGKGSREVREFIVHNALYWVEEFHVDGLRLDASHAMIDDSPKHILDELRDRVLEAAGDRKVHLILENECNIASRLARSADGQAKNYTAQWNHDITHLLAAVLGKPCEERRSDDGGETEKLAKSLARGFVIATEENGGDENRAHVPSTAYIAFMQTHDLVGNRIFGDRISDIAPTEAIRAIACMYLLCPQIPMLFMGEEWAASTPFPYFTDYHGELGEAVRKGRCEQLAKQDPAPSADELKRAPNPQAESTLRSAQLRWHELAEGPHADWFAWYRKVIAARQRSIVPALYGLHSTESEYQVIGPGALQIQWTLAEGTRLEMAANLRSQETSGFAASTGPTIWQQGSEEKGTLGPWSVHVSMVTE